MPYTCRRCGQEVPHDHAVCPNCGAAAHRPDDVIRCSHCRRRASSALTLCPHCGRALKPWRPDRALATGGVLLLLLLWLVLGGGFGVLGRAARGLVALLPPPATVAPAPVAAPTIFLPTATPALVVVQPTSTVAPPSSTPTIPASETPTPAPTATATPEVSAEQVYIVQPGDTPIGIAAQFDISVQELLDYNNISDPTSLRVNQELRIPSPVTATPTGEPSATPTVTATVLAAATATSTQTPSPTATVSTSGPQTYTVQPGDTPFDIATRFGVTVAALLAYNNISDPTSLRVNQELRIPPADYVPPTPTPRPPTRTPTPAPTPTPGITLQAPLLTNPGDGATYQNSDAFILLKWENPGGLPAGVENVLYIGVLVGVDAIEWRFNDPLGSATEFRVPAWLYRQAPQSFGGTYVWYVQAASVTRTDGEVTAVSPVSPPSPQNSFKWN